MFPCPNCGKELSLDGKVCPSCSRYIEGRSSKAQEPYLSDDRWTFKHSSQIPLSPGKDEKPPKQKHASFADGVPGPSGAGYTGTSNPEKLFDSTINVVQKASPHEKSKGSSRRAPPTPTVTLFSKHKTSKKTPLRILTSAFSAWSRDNDDPAAQPDKNSPGKDFYVESDSALKRKATAPQLVKFRFNNSKDGNNGPYQDGAPTLPPNRGGDSPLGNKGSHPNTRLKGILTFSSLVFIFTWFVPDVWAEHPLYSHDQLSLVHGTELVALLIKPVVGSLLLAILILPVSEHARAATGALLGIITLTTFVLWSPVPLPFQSSIILAMVIFNLALAIALLVSKNYQWMNTVISMIVPIFLFGAGVAGILKGTLHAGNLTLFKAPLEIFAGIFLAANGTAFLFRSVRKDGRQ